MNTIPDTSMVQAASFRGTVGSNNAEARFITRNLHRLWHRRRLQARLLHPFRKVLRPLALWLQQEHFHLEDGTGPGASPAPLKLRRAGWPSFLLGVILAPLAFVLLLPLLILIFPALVVVGLAAIGAAAFQTNDEETSFHHHSVAWHAVH